MNSTESIYTNSSQSNGSARTASGAGGRASTRKNASKYVGFDKATFRVRPDLLERLRKTSFFMRRDMSELVNCALEDYLPAQEEEAANKSES